LCTLARRRGPNVRCPRGWQLTGDTVHTSRRSEGDPMKATLRPSWELSTDHAASSHG